MTNSDFGLRHSIVIRVSGFELLQGDMRAAVQRVTRARVTVGAETTGEIGPGRSERLRGQLGEPDEFAPSLEGGNADLGEREDQAQERTAPAFFRLE